MPRKPKNVTMANWITSQLTKQQNLVIVSIYVEGPVAITNAHRLFATQALSLCDKMVLASAVERKKITRELHVIGLMRGWLREMAIVPADAGKEKR